MKHWAKPREPDYADDQTVRRVRSNGEIKWQGELVYVSQLLAGEVVGLAENAEGDADVYFAQALLGTIDAVTLKFARVGGRKARRQLGGNSSAALPAPVRLCKAVGTKER